MLRTCLVTTLRDATNEILDFFIRYHLAIGFDHLFLFFDSPDELVYSPLLRDKRITIFRSGKELEKFWKQTVSYGYYSRFTNQEVMARQILNTEVAIKFALEMELNWILHIDIDELFYYSGKDIHSHFDEMEMKNTALVNYLNHEAFPESFYIDNYFKEVDLFKKNPILLTEEQRVTIISLHGNIRRHFNYYWKGKSAARVHKDLVPNGVHGFVATSPSYRFSDPCILHYPCCGYNNFITKYKTLGIFQDKWFGETDIIKRIPIHLIARDLIAEDDSDLSKEFYEEVFLKQDRNEKQHLINKGIYFRIPTLDLYF